ncbi:Foldase protein PrsA 3 precursor [compost metagenome]
MKHGRVFTGLLLSCLALYANGDGPAVARVNGVEIESFRFERYFSDFLTAQGRSIGAIRNPGLYKRLRREALDDLIDKELLWQAAQREGVEVDEAAVQEQLATLRGKFKTPEDFSRRLAEDGFDEASYTEYLRHEYAAQRMFVELSKPREPSDAEVRQLYEENRAQLQRPEQLRARHILLKIETDEDAAAVEKRIAELREKIRGGADFAEQAREHSQDSSASVGGELGWFSRGDMQKPFEEAAFALQPGELSEPVRTVYGWHLIELEERKPAEPIAESEGLELARRYLIAQAQKQAGVDALKRLREEGRVELARGQ